MAFRWMTDKNYVKDIFDHFRNFLISGAIFYASLYTIQTANSFRGGKILGLLTGLGLFILFLIIFTANTVQGFKLLIPNPNKTKALLRRFIIVVVLFFYFLCIFQIVDSVVIPKLAHSADWKFFAEDKKHGLKINLDMDSLTSPRKGILRIWEELVPEKNRWENDTGGFLISIRSLKEINCDDRSIKILIQKQENTNSKLPLISKDLEPYFIEPNTPDEMLYNSLCKGKK